MRHRNAHSNNNNNYQNCESFVCCCLKLIKVEIVDMYDKCQRHILLLEDDPIIQLIHSQYLEDLGYSFDLAKTGKEAIELYRRNQYSLMLLDKGLPDMDSLDFCRMVRKDYSKNELPIFIITATGNIVKNDCLQAGCNEFFIKPVDKEVLSHAIKQWIDYLNPTLFDRHFLINISNRSASHVNFNKTNRPNHRYR